MYMNIYGVATKITPKRVRRDDHLLDRKSNICSSFSTNDLKDICLENAITGPFSDQERSNHSDTCTLTSERPQANNCRQPGDGSESAYVDERVAHHHWRALCSQLLSVDEEAVSDLDLLTLLLSYLDPAHNSRKLAMKLISRFETFGNVITARHTQISAVAEVEPRVVGFFRLVRAAGTRLAREEISHRPVVDGWAKLLTYLRATMAHQTVEQFRVLFLDRSNTLIADEVQHRGTIDHTPVYPREVARRALELDASALIMVHNHPSNKPAPSKADIEMTEMVRDAVEKLGIVLHDHIIIARRGHSSFRAMGLLKTKAR
jgi:DNA repair protein RadC